MKCLITNDDGIDAEGLAAMERALELLGNENPATIVAPNRGYSSCGHVTTFLEPLRVEKQESLRFKVFGTPADCARLGLLELAKDTQVVLSGINAGANAGVDLWMSGTVAAVRESGWLGVPAIAISQYFRGREPRDWNRTSQMAARALEKLLAQPLGAAYWNVNLPDVDTPVDEIEIKRTFIEPKHFHVSFDKNPDGTYQFAGDYQGRPRTSGSDVDVCFGGAISICEVPWPRSQ